MWVWIERHATHHLKESNMSWLTLIVFIKAWETNSWVKAMTDTVWSELIHNPSVLFFQITVIWRETHYSECVKGFFSLLSLCMNGSNRMTCSLNAVCRQVGSFNSTSHNTYFVFARRDSRLRVGLSPSFELVDKPQTFFKRQIFDFHLLTNQIFISSTCTQSTFRHTAPSQTAVHTYLIVTITNYAIHS